MGASVKIFLLLITILFLGCSSQKVPKFVEGCLYGTIMTYNQLMGQPFPQEYLEPLYEHCEQADGKSN